MSSSATHIEKRVKAFCALIGAEPLLVQGAGGNISWKDGRVLWVKASGTKLAEAGLREIFVPVNLEHLQGALAKQDFSVEPEMVCASGLRPSIETLLHALMPHKVVVHLHLVEVLAYLVRLNVRDSIETILAGSEKWIFVDYFKPGAELAKAIASALADRPDAEIVFMANHGVVIGGSNVQEVADKLQMLTRKFAVSVQSRLPATRISDREQDLLSKGYTPCCDGHVSLLALNEELIERLRYNWALYPDHVVFLGSEPAILERGFTEDELGSVTCSAPPYIFAVGDSVYQNRLVTTAQADQLRCYFDILSRQSSCDTLINLTAEQVNELLDWDAEVYRQQLAKDRKGFA